LGQASEIELARLSALPFVLFESGFALNPIILEACQQAGFTPMWRHAPARSTS
jgi:hypothetical protein